MEWNDDGTWELEREDDAIPCPKCKGYSRLVDCTDEEEEKHGCWPGLRHNCCCRAFVCLVCGHRVAMKAPAPEVGW